MTQTSIIIIAILLYILLIIYNINKLKIKKEKAIKDIEKAVMDGRKAQAKRIKTTIRTHKIRNTGDHMNDFTEYDHSTYEYQVNGKKYIIKRDFDFTKSPLYLDIYYRKGNPKKIIEIPDSISTKSSCLMYLLPIAIIVILSIAFKIW